MKAEERRTMIVYKDFSDFAPEDLKLIDDSWHEYFASRDGGIYRKVKDGRLRQIFGAVAGALHYRQVNINGVLRYVHRLVASAFLEPPEGRKEWLRLHPSQKNYQPMQVHHKDGDHENNAAANLEWAEHDDHRHMHRGVKWSAESREKLSKALKRAAAKRRKLTNACRRQFDD